jgi:large subunit ribosomal protein L22
VIATAKLRYLGVSAQKTRRVVDQIRGRSAEEALAILRASPQRVARDLTKVVQSALANAQQKDHKVNVDRLVVAWATVDEGPPMKRARANSMGRIFRILKKSCHVRIDLDLVPERAARRGAAPRR